MSTTDPPTTPKPNPVPPAPTTMEPTGVLSYPVTSTLSTSPTSSPPLPSQPPLPPNQTMAQYPVQTPPVTGNLPSLLVNQPAVYAFLIALVGLVGAVVLVAINKSVPDQLWGITGGAGLVGGGALVPRGAR